MKQDTLQQLVDKNLSTYQIADQLNCSQTTIRYWLRKYKIRTNIVSQKFTTDKKCLVCDNLLEKQQLKFCSGACKAKDHYANVKRKNPNSTFSQNYRGIKRKAKIIMGKGGCCQKCGYDKNLSALQFHHTNEKNFNLDIRAFSNTSLERLEAEADLCIVLCGNCHAEHHYPQSNDWKNPTS